MENMIQPRAMNVPRMEEVTEHAVMQFIAIR
jgi:hypothetical protein